MRSDHAGAGAACFSNRREAITRLTRLRVSAATLSQPTVTTPTVTATASPRLSAAELREREAKRKIPPAQQEFERAWAAGEPTERASTTTTASASSSETTEPAPEPTSSDSGGAEEFAP